MLLILATAALLQTSVTIGSRPKQDTTKLSARDSTRAARRDSVRARVDSIREDRANRPPRRDSVTASHLSSAFRDGAARSLLERARVARLEQDSTLLAYDATAYQRISAGLGFKKIGRDRLIFRHENASRVRWRRGEGVWIDVKGLRTALPAVPKADVEMDADDDFTPIPYYPGREAIWVGSGMVKREVDDREIVHPLAVGAEAYYQYTTGDSIIFRLPDGSRIRLGELRVTARRPKWNLIVGSFWFDLSSAQLVRAAYRLSIPMDIVEVAEAEEDHDDDDDIPRWLRPMTANIKGITVEYGLHKGRWWLPRSQVAEGDAQVSIMRVPFKLEESFKYASVNGTGALPKLPALALREDSLAENDSAAVDSTASDSTGRRRKRASSVDDGDAMIHMRQRNREGLLVVTRVPKDSAMLATSPDLPKSIYDDGDELFGRAEADELMRELDFGLQAGWDPQRPKLFYGPQQGLLRYNRVEGLSAGVMATQTFGAGYSGSAMLRMGTADHQLNGELGFLRSDGRRTLGVTAYRRLAVVNDWGDPFALGPSVSALLFGREDGLYYRSFGAELTATTERRSPLSFRLFAERHTDADVETHFSVAHVINDIRFVDNVEAKEGSVAGIGARFRTSRGLDPHGFRLLADVRAEGAAGAFDYSRGAFDATLSHGLGPLLDGSLTVSGGTSGGRVPAQRLWYLGGAQTIRGHDVGVASGDAFWMGRVELGSSFVAARPVIFYDFGWAGSRADWQNPGIPVSGAGIGASFMDGLFRFDLAKGVRPNTGVRAYFYLEAKF
ncbi:MAG: hypothetical protein H7Z74_13685 [Anaerolineae bacterium]|nr:hypothetical protein [Gemmatimonadaceae bacterium]